MLREDVPGRFDYLFEPLDVVESAGDGDGDDSSDDYKAAPRAQAPPDNQNRWSNRIVLAGVVLATMAAAAATAVALLQPAQPAQQLIVPTDATPASSTAPAASSPVMPTTTAAPAPVVSASQPPDATPAIEQQRPPEPSTNASTPAETRPPGPTTRAPISVSPESRAPFPNQTPPRSNDQRGGLLGGLGGLGGAL